MDQSRVSLASWAFQQRIAKNVGRVSSFASKDKGVCHDNLYVRNAWP